MSLPEETRIAASPAVVNPPPDISAPNFVPPVPWKLKDTGLSSSLLELLVSNQLYGRGEMSGRVIADALGLSFSVIEPVMDEMKSRQLIEVKGSLGYGTISSLFSLTELGRKRSRESSGATRYTGPAPVPVAQYIEGVRRQKPGEGWVSQERLAHAYRNLVITRDALAEIGPAVNCGKSLLLYGQPGNGKTFLAEALIDLAGADVFVPYALEHNGSVVQIFDPLHHRPADPTAGSGTLFSLERAHDSRWVRCKRPFIVTGGELTLAMLELSYNSNTHVYDAPFHLKANNGIYLIDDFGRQRVTPAELLNRWIIPMESRVDHLTLPSGGKLTLPFEAFLIFSTNLNPSGLGDEAFLRRMQYKMFVRNPDAGEFRKIFRGVCASKGISCPPDLLEIFIQKHYTRTSRKFRRCHPRDVISHALDLIEFEKAPYELNEEVLDRSFHSCFVHEEPED